MQLISDIQHYQNLTADRLNAVLHRYMYISNN